LPSWGRRADHVDADLGRALPNAEPQDPRRRAGEVDDDPAPSLRPGQTVDDTDDDGLAVLEIRHPHDGAEREIRMRRDEIRVAEDLAARSPLSLERRADEGGAAFLRLARFPPEQEEGEQAEVRVAHGGAREPGYPIR